MDETQDDGLLEQSIISGESQVCIVNDGLSNDEDISFILVPECMLQALKDSGYDIPNVLIQNAADLALEKSNDNEILPSSYVEICKLSEDVSEPNHNLDLYTLVQNQNITSNPIVYAVTSASPFLPNENGQNATVSAEYRTSSHENFRKVPSSTDNTNVVYTLSVNPTCMTSNLETTLNPLVMQSVSQDSEATPGSSQSQSILVQKSKDRKLISDNKSMKRKVVAVSSSPLQSNDSKFLKDSMKQCDNIDVVKDLGRTTTNQAKQKLYKCPHFDCALSFKTMLKLKHHLPMHEQETQPMTQMPGCSNTERIENLSSTQSMQMAQVNSVNHNPEMRISGRINGNFKKDGVQSVPDNTAIKPYKCNYSSCKRSFTLESKLRTHQKSHTASKRYSCPFATCVSSFHKQEELKCHLKVHSCKPQENKQEEFPDPPVESSEESLIYYLCPYQDCGSLFTTIIDAKQHLSKFHNDSTDNNALVDCDENVEVSEKNSPSKQSQNSIVLLQDGDIPDNTHPTSSSHCLLNGSGETSSVSQEYMNLPNRSKSSYLFPTTTIACTVLPSSDSAPNNPSQCSSTSSGFSSTTCEQIYKTAIRSSSILSTSAAHGSPTIELRKQIVVTSKENKSKQLFKCGVMNCNKIFASKKELEGHAPDHEKLEVHKCTYPNCPWSFKTPYKLKRHLTSHEQKKQHKCKFPGCTKVCSTSYNLQAHYKRHFEDNQLTCSTCNENFPNKHKLYKHIRDTHNPEPSFVCEYEDCDRKFHSSAALTTHMNSHTAKKTPLICREPGCNNKVFKKNCLYKEHIMTHHTGVKPYKCDFPDCKWAFPNRSKLRRHQMTHNSMKRYFCPIANCKSAFHRLEHLKYHLRVHTWTLKDNKAEDSPVLPIESSEEDFVYYLCPYQECGSLFTTLIGAKQHIQKLHSSTAKSSSEENDAKTANVPVSITLETMTRTDAKAVALTDDSNTVTVTSDAIDPNQVTTKADSPASTKSNISSLLSTMLQSQSCERPSENILLSTKTIDSVPQDLQFVGLSSTDPTYPNGPNMDLDNVANFTLAVQQDSMPMRIDPSQYLLGSSGDFVANSRPVTETEPMDFITLQQQSVYRTSNPADQFLNFNECEPSVDPNIIMPVPISLNQPSTSKRTTVLENTDEEDCSTTADDCNNNVEASGSARTDCDAYRRACLGKKIKSGVNTNLFMSPKQAFLDTCHRDVLDEGMPDLGAGLVHLVPSKDVYYEVGALMNDPTTHKEQYKDGELESLQDCARNFAGSTINLNDLA